MTPQRRVVITLAITALAVVAISAFGVQRMSVWHERGWAMLTYFPQMQSPAAEKKAPRAFGYKPGAVALAYPGGPADKAGIRMGDVVESINGVPVSDHRALEEIDRRLRVGDKVTYGLSRGDQKLTATLTLVSPITNHRTFWAFGVSLLLAASFLGIGLLVYLRQPDDRRAFVFFAMVAVGALSFLTTAATSFDGSALRGIAPQQGLSLLVVAMMLIFVILFMALTLHLALVFPHDRPITVRRPYIFRWIYGLPLFGFVFIAPLFSAAFVEGTRYERFIDSSLGANFGWLAGVLALAGAIVALLVARRARTEGVLHAFLSRPLRTIFIALAALATVALMLYVFGWRPAGKMTLVFGSGLPLLAAVAYPVLACIALYRSYREAGVEEKRQVKWPLWGTIIAIGSRVLVSIIGLFLGFAISAGAVDVNEWMSWMQALELAPRLLYLLIPISFAFAILKYRLMNIDIIIKKTVAYGILTGAILFLYLVLVGGLGTVLVNVAGVQNQTMVIASTLVVALVFIPLRNKLQFLVDRNLFRQKYDYPQALRAISNETLTATDLIAFLSTSAETIQQAVQNRAVVIFARRQDEFVASAKVGVGDNVLGSLRIDTAGAEAVDRALDPRRRQLPPSAADALKRIQAAFVVPARSHGTLQALIALAPKLSDREFDLEDLEFLSSAADQIAIAADRIRLRYEEEDFEQARVMQQALLPAEVPQIKGLDVSGTWHPARAVGGDYYDLIELSETQAGICIGDVAGKGMPAALLMSALQAAVRASASENVQPKELCERVRRVVVPSLGGRFVTFFFCTIDMASGRILYCNAGHNPPVLVRANGEVIRLSKGGSVFSRLFRNERFEQGEVDLRDGDRVVLFTDGVSEARDAAGSDYGETRLEEFIAAHRTSSARDLIASILDSVTSFSGGRTDDDVTLVAVAITQRPLQITPPA